jgi:hypothetical protein
MIRRRAVRCWFRVACVLAVAVAGEVGAQAKPPESGGFTAQLGQPHIRQLYHGLAGGFLLGDGHPLLVTEWHLGVYRDLVNPLSGLLGIEGEVYAGTRRRRFDYGVRAQFASRYFRLGLGIDLNVPDRRANLLVSLMHPLKRGGILLPGTEVRANYVPARDHLVSIGLERPLSRAIPVGTTRPRASTVKLARAATAPARVEHADAQLLAVLDTLSRSGHWITRLTLPFLDQRATGNEDGADAAMDELLQLRAYLLQGEERPGSWTPVHEVRHFHRLLERAFALASGTERDAAECIDLGRIVADHARAVLLDEVLFPYDRLLGRIKEPDSLAGFGAEARGVFVRRLHLDNRLPRESIAHYLGVFGRLIDVVEESRRYQHAQWRDARFVWLPLQFGLLPEQHDSQAELDDLIERITRVAFTEGNNVWYIVNEQFPLQLSRTIRETRDYHVLWIHDIRGVDNDGHPDEMTYRHVLGAYLAALIRNVRAYDETGTFPVYMVFLDQHYYEVNRSRMWLDFLEDPLRRKLDLPRGFEAWEDSIAAAQQKLRIAVSESRLLQQQAAQFGQGWLNNLVSIHVSITNPADPTFWRNDVIPIWGIPDNVMRDHRKVAFYDVSEADPYRGGAIYTGAGVGENYASLSWEDRSILVEGPALLTLKQAAREALLNQGMAAERIPWALQPRPVADTYAEQIRVHRDTARMNVRALDVHNQTGYHAKDLNVLKAVLYTMMPPGSLAIVPDGLWSAGFWGSLLVGHALRGGRTLVIAPAETNAPSRALGGTVRIEEVLSRIALSGVVLRDIVEAQGGLLKVGVYSPTFQVTDIKAKLDAFKETAKRHAWFRELYDFEPQVYAAFEKLSIELQGQNERWQRMLQLEDPGVSKLHLKANFLASKEAWAGLMHLDGWPEILRAFLQRRVWQVENRDRALSDLDAAAPDVIDVGQPMIDRWLAELTPAEREPLVLYLMLGSHNQNYRSMLLDGEDAFVVAGTNINAGLFDLAALTGQVHWVEDVKELSRFYPRRSSLMIRLASWLRTLL